MRRILKLMMCLILSCLCIQPVYAQGNSIRIYFHSNSEQEMFTSEEYFLGDNKQIETTFTRDGYEMIGWSYSPQITEVEIELNAIVTDEMINNINGSMDLYAVWQEMEPETIETKNIVLLADSNYKYYKIGEKRTRLVLCKERRSR